MVDVGCWKIFGSWQLELAGSLPGENGLSGVSANLK